MRCRCWGVGVMACWGDGVWGCLRGGVFNASTPALPHFLPNVSLM